MFPHVNKKKHWWLVIIGSGSAVSLQTIIQADVDIDSRCHIASQGHSDFN